LGLDTFKIGVEETMTQELRFSTTDECPSCKKLCKDMVKEHGGKIPNVGGTFVICVRCGALFMPKSQVKYLFDKPVSTIIDPNSPQGTTIIQNLPVMP
jgi:C4-type Zn-finger protein